MRKPATAASAVILILLTLAGCGSSVDKNAYVEKVTKVQQTTTADTSKLSTDLGKATSVSDVADKLTELGDAVEKDSQSLAAITAPEEVASQHADYVALMKKFGTDLKALAGRVDKATPATVGSVLQDASKLTSTLSANEAKIISSINAQLQS